MLSRKTRLTLKGLAVVILVIAAIVPLSLAATANGSGNQQTITTAINQKLSSDGSQTPTTLWTGKIPAGLTLAGQSPVVADLSGDGESEVLVWMQNGSAALDMATQWRQRILYCLNGSTGSEIWNYIILGGDPPVVADLFGNGKLEVLFGSFDYNAYCLDGTTGTKLWSYTTEGFIYCSPVVADLFGNSEKEVLVGSEDYNLYCLNGTMGSRVWNCTRGCVYSCPIVSDLCGDGKLEVTGGADESVYCLESTTGNVLWSYPTDGSVVSSPVVVDLFGNGTMVVIFGTSPSAAASHGPGGAPALTGSTGSAIYCIVPPKSSTTTTSGGTTTSHGATTSSGTAQGLPSTTILGGVIVAGAVALVAITILKKKTSSNRGT